MSDDTAGGFHDYGDMTALAFTPDGKRLVTGSKDNTAMVWKR